MRAFLNTVVRSCVCVWVCVGGWVSAIEIVAKIYINVFPIYKQS